VSGRWSAESSAKVIERVVIEGTLELVTPAHLGDGVGYDNTMSLLTDALEGHPLLTGASLAGALRNALREREVGYGKPETSDSLVVLLFGGMRGMDDGDHTRLIVDDAFGEGTAIQRDGVKIDTRSRTASDSALYTIEAWDAGTRFNLRFELNCRESDNSSQLKTALATALDSLSKGHISLGARKRRGFGQIKVDAWYVRSFVLNTLDGLMDWLHYGHQPLASLGVTPHKSIFEALNVSDELVDNRQCATLKAYFTIHSSLLIRKRAKIAASESVNPDFVFLQDSGGNPILSGTSVGGILRARALKIARTIYDGKRAYQLVEDIFGTQAQDKVVEKNLKASRLTVRETTITGGIRNKVQARVSIDRFTGGALDTALFTEQPVFGSNRRGVKIQLHLRDPKDYELGLLLLLLKDLWSGDLLLGGEASIGRGRLCGEKAHLSTPQGQWEFKANGEQLDIKGNSEQLQSKLEALHKYLKRMPT
jgi:CRISPR/Cas system CSM-associated protein Csm3 (group 7 of RAMP superfamily)